VPTGLQDGYQFREDHCAALCWDQTDAREPMPVQSVGQPTAHLAATLRTDVMWAPHSNQAGRKLKDWACSGLFLTREAGCPLRTACCFTSTSSVLWSTTHALCGLLLAARSPNCNSSVFDLQIKHLGTLLTANSRTSGYSILRRPHHNFRLRPNMENQLFRLVLKQQSAPRMSEATQVTE
jgi:hypothetical protein